MLSVTDELIDVQTIFKFHCDPLRSHLFDDYVKNALLKLFRFDRPFSSASQVEEALSNAIPSLRAEVWGRGPFYLSIQVASSFLVHCNKFFNEMLSRSLLPGKLLVFQSSFSSQFSLCSLKDASFLFMETVVEVDSEEDLDTIRKNLIIFENELFLGFSAAFQAERILKSKGVSVTEKTLHVQDVLFRLISKRSDVFDDDLFSFMQQFFLFCGQDFVAVRDEMHLSKVIAVAFLYKKMIQNLCALDAGQRYVKLKISRFRHTSSFEMREGLSIVVAINFTSKNELFSGDHLLKSISNYLPNLSLLEDSVVILPSSDGKIQLVYLEIEKPGLDSFCSEEIRLLREKLPADLKNHVEKLMPSIFLPRNEEEVMKNILVLTHELRLCKDLPQVIISFDKQEEDVLSFTVIFLRICLKAKTISLQQLYKRGQGKYMFIEDRVQTVGLLRGRYPKEATVFHLKLPKNSFVREDHSLDLLKARQEVVLDVESSIGEFRDYNGGMIALQNEKLIGIKEALGFIEKSEELVLENFFHSLHPVEFKVVATTDSLLALYQLFKMSHSREGLACSFIEEDRYVCLITKSKEPIPSLELSDLLKDRVISSCQLLTGVVPCEGVYYLCSLLFSDDESVRGRWRSIASSMSAMLSSAH